MNLLRDVAQLQVHLGHYDSLQETRWQILKLRPNLRQNWIGYAVACNLNGNLLETRKVLAAYLSTLKVCHIEMYVITVRIRCVSRMSQIMTSNTLKCYFITSVSLKTAVNSQMP